MLEAARLIGRSLAKTCLIGAGVGIGAVFCALIVYTFLVYMGFLDISLSLIKIFIRLPLMLFQRIPMTTGPFISSIMPSRDTTSTQNTGGDSGGATVGSANGSSNGSGNGSVGNIIVTTKITTKTEPNTGQSPAVTTTITGGTPLDNSDNIFTDDLFN